MRDALTTHRMDDNAPVSSRVHEGRRFDGCEFVDGSLHTKAIVVAVRQQHVRQLEALRPRGVIDGSHVDHLPELAASVVTEEHHHVLDAVRLHVDVQLIPDSLNPCDVFGQHLHVRETASITIRFADLHEDAHLLNALAIIQQVLLELLVLGQRLSICGITERTQAQCGARAQRDRRVPQHRSTQGC